MREDPWLPPPGDLVIRGGETHVWRASLDLDQRAIALLAATLAPEERARMDRFLVEHARRRFVASHGFLRDVLARYTGRPPATLAFAYGEHGKPSLAGGPHFNLSHAGDVALLAVSSDAPLGVDVELVRPLPDFEAVAARFFASGEIAALRRAPADRYADAWYRCWTRKEAYIKATGDGLHCPLDRFEVSLLPDEPPRLRALDGSEAAAGGWTVVHLEPGRGTVGALAIEARSISLRLFDWTPPA